MTSSAVDPVAGTPPSRFREAEQRGVAMGWGLRRLGRVDGTVDEMLMGRLGAMLTESDRVAGALADAIRTRAGGSGRVRNAQVRSALQHGIDAVPDAPPALREFVDTISATPTWVDWDLVAEGARVMVRLGRNAADVLMQLSLIGGYRFGGPPDLLVRTGGLTGRQTRRRLAETQHWAITLTEPDALRPGGAAWRLTAHVRLMHALVNATHVSDWDVARWGLPVNLADQTGTQGLFDGTLILGCRALGVPIPPRDARALMHLWRYVGWLIGVPDELLTEDEWERHRINYHILLSAPRITPAGGQLARAAFDAQRDRTYPGPPGAWQRVRARFEQERMLSMMSVFLGARSMRELGLPRRPPWAFAYLVVLNTLRYRVLDRLPGGRRRREAWGTRTRARILASYFGPERHDVGPLEAERSPTIPA